jgi:uncharacterized membrane protein
VPIIINGYHAPAPPKNAVQAQFGSIDDIFARYPVLTLVHILPALLFIVIGPFQFSRKFRNQHWLWHKRMGRVFVLCGAIIGITGLVMSIAMPAIGGVNQAASTFLFAILFLIALYKAYYCIRQRQIALHREWMLRAYAIGLAVATIRPIVGIFFGVSRFTGLTPHEFFGTAFWIGFVLHLVLAETYILQEKNNCLCETNFIHNRKKTRSYNW